jgi:hypothetical protein
VLLVVRIPDPIKTSLQNNKRVSGASVLVSQENGGATPNLDPLASCFYFPVFFRFSINS